MIDALKGLVKRSALARPAIFLKGLVTQPTAQNDESAVLADLIARHDIPRRFIELGFGGWEFNCASLARTWNGLLVDADPYNVTIARTVLPARVQAEQQWLTLDNMEVVRRYAQVRKIGVLSIDVDGNDYWFLQSLIALRPAIIIAEFNPVFGPRTITIPYDPAFDRRTKSRHWTYYGASLSALTHLCEPNGYRLVAVTKTGFNAFFLRADLLNADDIVLDHREVVGDRQLPNGQKASDNWRDIARLPYAEVGPAFAFAS